MLGFLTTQPLHNESTSCSGESLKEEGGPEVTKSDPGVMSLSITPFSIKMKRPMKLSLGMLTERAGLLIALESESVRVHHVDVEVSLMCWLD